MRNFHRDFESLNQAYDNSVRTKQKSHETLYESTSSDIDNIHRSGSIKQLREALGKLCAAHTEDQSSLTYEEVCTEIKKFAEEQMVPKITTPPTSSMHNEPVTGLAQEQKDEEEDEDEVEEGTDGSTGDLTEREKFKLAADAAKKGKGPLKKESSSGNIHAALKDDEDADHYEKTGEVRKKKTEDDSEDKKNKVGENFEKMLEILKLTDQVQLESDDVVEEEMYDCIRDYMSDGYSYSEAMKKCSGRGYEESSKTDEEDEDKESIEEADPSAGDLSTAVGGSEVINPQLIKTAKTLAGGKGKAGMFGMGRNPEKTIQKAYGSLMNSVADKLTTAVNAIEKPAPVDRTY